MVNIKYVNELELFNSTNLRSKFANNHLKHYKNDLSKIDINNTIYTNRYSNLSIIDTITT